MEAKHRRHHGWVADLLLTACDRGGGRCGQVPEASQPPHTHTNDLSLLPPRPFSRLQLGAGRFCGPAVYNCETHDRAGPLSALRPHKQSDTGWSASERQASVLCVAVVMGDGNARSSLGPSAALSSARSGRSC